MKYDIDRETVLAAPAEASASTIETFFHELEAVLATSPPTLRIDCASIQRAVSGHVGILWTAQRHGAEAGIPVVLTNVSPMTMRILQVLDVAGLFEYEDLREGAIPPSTGKIPVVGVQTYRQRFPVSASAARQALRRMLTFLNDAGLPALPVLDIQTIAYELLQNIVLHSGADATDDIRMEVEYDPENVQLMISDHGTPFDLTSEMDEIDLEQAAADRRTHGFGLLLIRRLADAIRYDRSNGRNVVTVVRKVR